MITFQQLRMVDALARTGSMRRAADMLALSQPALSQQLQTLEARLGIRLFDRIPKGMQPTPGGEALLEEVRAILAAVRRFEDRAARIVERPVGAIRFGTTPTIGPYLLPGVVRRLHAAFPDVRLYIREGIPREQHAELLAGELDMVLSPLPIDGAALQVEPLFREPLRIVAAPDDPIASAPEMAALSGRTFLTLDHRHHFHAQLAALCERVGATILGDYMGTSLDALQQMAGTGVGLALLPEIYVRSKAAALDAVRLVDPVGWAEFRSVGVAWRRGAAYADLFALIAEIIRAEAEDRLA